MSTEPWKKQGRGRRRNGRSTSQSGGGRRSSTDLGVWCDANISRPLARKLGTLITNGQALKSVVDMVKMARAKSEVLSSTQRIALEEQLRRAGPWEMGAGPASTSGKAVAPQRAA